MRIASGISRIGGKYRLINKLLTFTPYHEFFLSLFAGAAHFELNKPRCRYECFNDAESEIINYFLQIRKHPKEFDEMKQGVFGLVSQEICNRIINGKIKTKNDLERAYFFYYLNKLTFAGSINKGYGYMIDNHNLSREGYGRVDSKVIENAKKDFKTKGYAGLNQNRAIPKSTFHEKDIEDIKAKFRGVAPAGFQKKVDGAKANFKGLQVDGFQVRKTDVKRAKISFRGITPKASFKGINPKTTRPFENNDWGLLSPLMSEAIERLRYVNLTCYDFRKVYKMFYEAFHVRKGLNRECFIYADPPYPGTEKYYGNLFPRENHQDLIEIMLKTPFNFMLSIGGDCEFYLDSLKENDWHINPVKVKYSTDANSQKESQEYIITNYNINNTALMTIDSNQQTMEGYF